MCSRLALAMLVPMVIAIPATATANPIDHFGWGARASGLAGAATAVVDDFSANYYNPGALASDPRLRIDLGYTIVEPVLQINGADLNVDQSRGLHGGVVLPGELFDRIVAFSVGIFLPDERITRIRARPQGQPRFVVYDNRPQRIVVTTSLAVQIIEDLFVGAGLTYVANTKGTLDLAGDISATDAEETELLTGIDVSFESVRYPSFGVLWTPGNWRFGVSFRDEFSLELDIDVDVDGAIFLGRTQVDEGTLAVAALNHNLFSPRQVYAGIAHETEDWLLSFDLGWLQWSEFPAPTAEIVIDLELENLEFDIPGPDSPLDPDFDDILVVRFAGEGRVLDTDYVDLTLRGGYFLEPSPAPDQPGLTNYVDSDKHGFTLGTSLEIDGVTEVLPGPVLLDLAGLFIVLDDRTYLKDDPADPVGDFEASGFIGGFTATSRIIF